MSGDRYEMVVGLEVHVQLLTRTKAFCNCSTGFGAPPNLHTCPVCLGLPGALPVLNATAVRLAARAAIALECVVEEVSAFARKNYFYPDLPKGYQITQYDRPLAKGGHLSIGRNKDGTPVRIGITRVHIEEDAGKSLHDRYPGATAIDLNRAGVPLIEIVSEPDIRSSLEAGAYLGTLKQILEYVRVSDVSMEEGSLRVDANISTRLRGDVELGTKTEIKNLNSFSAVERALDAEFARQCAILERGEKVTQQTMLWDASRLEVRPSRVKEGSHDYRYFPDPDLLPLVLDKTWIGEVKQEMPELPAARQERLAATYGLAEAQIADLAANPDRSDYFEAVARAHGEPRTAANWVLGEVLAVLNETKQRIEHFPVRPADLARLLDMIRDGLVSHSAAKRIFVRMVDTGDRPEQIAEREGLLQVGDDAALLAWIDAVLAEHPEESQRFAAGERKLQGVLVGLVMKRSGGRADPRRVNQLLASRAGAGT
ncbi:MAG TPA: Asp-tRNA(Asn)/Glu-tRNA(Gln) amidotransferase subunit GatB [Gemmatimonadaceae bacterium]|nr:Asp-tRNA(Asn)/Glu-tRNA(Gln) amidotransferase subunit GatB [Gemmatimonadaceae bacterium]